MKTVIFQLELIGSTNQIKYPDDISKFSNTRIYQGNVIASYSGVLQLNEYIQAMPVVTITNIYPKDINQADKIVFDKEKNILYAQQGVPFRVIGKITNVPINDTWNTPIIKNGKIEAYFLTTNNGDDLLMQGSFPSAGMWEIDEDVINSGFEPPFKFIFPKIVAKVFSEF
jgi:hypothetical protein